MTRFVRTDIDPPVALLTIDNPPVNALTAGVWADIDAAVSAAAADPAVGAIVLIGGGTRFVAGADIRLFDQIQTSDDAMSRSAAIHAILRRIEDTPKPVIAAIHGQALGGGLELAMACHFRLAAADAELGLPEVRLGLIPGAGGTQRLPRLCGPELALRLCTGGTPMRAAEAHSVGLVDRLVGVETGKNGRDLRQYARQFAREVATRAEVRRTRDIAIDRAAVETGRRACEATRAALTTSARGTQAPLAVVDAIEAALAMGFDEGSVREREIFATRVLSLESRALRHLFFAERAAARLPVSVTSVPPVEIRSAAVVGAGTMGAGIAMTYANAGIPVLVKEVDEAALVRGMETIRRTYDSAVTRKRIDAAERDRRLALITPTTVFDEFAATDIVVEAVFEDLALKRQVFAELGRVTRPTCILATNTSTLDVDAIAAACGRPSRVVGHHFFSPANIMTLLEIVRGRETEPDVLATSLSLAKRLGKQPVIVGNCFGFVANRMLGYYLREALLLVEEGATVVQVDGAMTAFGLPVGPFTMEDIAGIDVGARIRRHRAAEGLGWAEGPQSRLPDRLHAMGRFGQKTGAGWYRYLPGSRVPVPDPVVDELAAEEARARGIARRAVSDDEIVARLATAITNEGAQILDDGFAQRAGDIDVIYCHGFGYPRWRGGPMFYADSCGLPVILERLRHYRTQFGDYWRAAPLLERLVAEGRGFYTQRTGA